MLLRELKPPEMEAILDIEEMEETLLILLKLLLLDFRRRGRLGKDELLTCSETSEILSHSTTTKISVQKITTSYSER